MGLLTFQIPSAVFLFGGAADLSNLMFFSFFFWRVAAIFAGLALFTGIHGYKPRLYAFSPAQSGCQQSGATWTHCAGCYQPLIFPPNFSNFPLCWMLPTFDFPPIFFNFPLCWLLPTFDFSNSVSALYWNYLIISKSYIIRVHR